MDNPESFQAQFKPLDAAVFVIRELTENSGAFLAGIPSARYGHTVIL